jgi:hypothetical protein
VVCVGTAEFEMFRLSIREAVWTGHRGQLEFTVSTSSIKPTRTLAVFILISNIKWQGCICWFDAVCWSVAVHGVSN